MQFPSFTLIFSGIFVAYILHSIWSITQLFFPPRCIETGKRTCLVSVLNDEPQLEVYLLSTKTARPQYEGEYSLLHKWTSFNYTHPFEMSIRVILPSNSHKQTFEWYLTIIVAPRSKISTHTRSWRLANEDPLTTTIMSPLAIMHVPEAKTFQLLSSDETDSSGFKSKKRKTPKPEPHFVSRVTMGLVVEELTLPLKLPQDISHLIRWMNDGTILPVAFVDNLSRRIRDLRPFNVSQEETELVFAYSPVSLGKLRLWTQFDASMNTMGNLGFGPKDLDEVKGIFVDANLYLLCITILVAAFHLLFDFLAFKNDVSFWRHRKSMAGVSRRTLFWRAFSHAVLFVYLMDEKTSMLILVPAFIGFLIEMWKVRKVLKVSFHFTGCIVPKVKWGLVSEQEKKTQEFDTEAMKYLSYLLYPLCICGAIYSLFYTPQRSWYSWCVQSLANGVYAFGFLFMLPQLFVNYRLKSVAHLPWRAFMYKAFNTFIDDLFAFIITMPTAHRIACFRDDVVFIIYLYQRWLYPVDSDRVDDGTNQEVKKKKD